MGFIHFTDGTLFMETNNPYEPPKKLCDVTDMDVVEDFEDDGIKGWLMEDKERYEMREVCKGNDH